MRIGILTGGGDVPGLNACIKAVVGRVSEQGQEVVGIRRGWNGLYTTDPDDPRTTEANLTPLDPAAVRTIDRSGGTVLHTSRTNPGRVKRSEVPPFLTAEGVEPFDFTPHVLRV
ncbi:MAG TPA: 6-phosphofructokinase, partial [Actinomycetota bacterium]|nr:6-phosphofructokinase [Actinomycetota bacterium]